MPLEISQTELGRLMGRGPWDTDVDSFAQELCALFPALFKEIPAGKLEAVATDANPNPITLSDFTTDGNAPFATVRRPNGDTFTINISPQGVMTADPGPNNQPIPPKKTSPTAPQPASFPGKVLSGTGDTYQVAAYTSGLDEAPEVVEVKQLSINASATIPADTWTTISCVYQATSVRISLLIPPGPGNTKVEITRLLYMQVPVWN